MVVDYKHFGAGYRSLLSINVVGEIGGNEEVDVSRFIKTKKIKKPIAGFVAGQTAPPGRRMGHAGAIISSPKSKQNKKKLQFLF